MASKSEIENQKLLIKIVRNKDKDIEARKLSIDKITNQEILGEIADDMEEDLIIRELAIGKITDYAILCELMKNRDKRIRPALIDSIAKNPDKIIFSETPKFLLKPEIERIKKKK